MKTAIEYIKDKNANTIPELEPVSEEEVNELVLKDIKIPDVILEIWRECGSGRFYKRKDNTVNYGTCLFIKPNEVYDVITDDYFIRLGIPEAGFPFFNYLDTVYLVINNQGNIIIGDDEEKTVIFENIHEFFKKLMEDNIELYSIE